MPVTLVCPVCSTCFKVKPSHAERRKYCSRACMSEGRQQRVECSSEHCGNSFEVVPSRLEHGRGKHCSRDCQYEANKEKLKSEDREAFECLNCASYFELVPSQLDKSGAGKYCSRECRDEHWRGENHPQYIHGSNAEDYGSNWQAQRRAARKRDNYICQHCGATDCPLDVHHKKPRRWYDDVEESNHLDNLITLCKPCHRVEEAKLQRLEREREA